MKHLLVAIGLGLSLALTPAIGQNTSTAEPSSPPSNFFQSELFQALGNSDKTGDKLQTEQSLNIEQISVQHKSLVLLLNANPQGQYFIEPSSVKVEIQGAQIASEQAYSRLDKQTGKFQLQVAVETLPKGSHVLNLQYQGCTQAGVCLPPAQIQTEFQTEQPINPSLWGKAATLLILGLLLGLSPCVLPIAPIVVSSLSGQQSNRGQRLSTSLLFLASMALVYAALGVIAGLSGIGLSGLLQTLPVRLGFAAFMVWIAYRTFKGQYGSGFNPPAFIARWMDRLNAQGPGWWQAAASGALSAFVVSPCVSGPLAGILAFIAQQGDPFRGALWLAVFCLGMGFPIVVCAALTITRIKASVWMQWANELSALLLVCLAVLTAAGNQGVFLPLALCMTTAYLIFKLASSAKQLDFVQRAVLTCAIGVLAPLTTWQVIQVLPTEQTQVVGETQQSLTSDEFLAKKNAGFIGAKGLHIYFVTAKWCATCAELKKAELSPSGLSKLLGEVPYTLEMVDVSENTAQDQAMLKAEGLFGPPAVYIVYEGRVLERFTGKMDEQALKAIVLQIKTLANSEAKQP